MVTSTGTLLEPPRTTPTIDTPPPVVEAASIPIQTLPTPTPAVVHDEHKNRWIAWALAGVLGVLAVLGGIFAYTSQTADEEPMGQMGLSQQAWLDYRAGERSSTVTPVAPSDWQSYRAGERAGTVTPVVHPSDWLAYRAGERASS